MRRVFSVLLLASAVVACGSTTSEAVPAAQDAPAAATSNMPSPVPLNGTVLEQLPAPPYLYLRLQTKDGDVWTAVPAGLVETGSVATVYNPMRMSNFQSKSLDRRFDVVYFGTLTEPGSPAESGNPHASMSKPSAITVEKLAKASGADARSIAEAWEQGAGLDGKSIRVRGTVVKYNPGVMGKNWMHLQDGSGDSGKGTNDLTVTTMDEVELGQTVIVRGTVAINKDFGAGYRYPIIVENAQLESD